jgi:large repetitive protein
LSTFPATVNLTVTNGSGCSIQEPYIVQTDFCQIPKGVSPNGDGKNDTFDLSGLNPKLVQIFNRYGVKVFEGANYTNQWYGQTNDGDELPAATYFYVAELNSGETKTGWVYLAR